MPAPREAIRPPQLNLGEDDNGRHRRKDHAANREQRDRPRRERRSLAALDGTLDRTMTEQSNDEQGARQEPVATSEDDVRRRSSMQ